MIVRFSSRVLSEWGGRNPFNKDRSKVWHTIHEHIANGSLFPIWHGQWDNQPKTWIEGPAVLVVKVGKKKKLVRGFLERIGTGQDFIEWAFIPRPRALTKELKIEAIHNA